MNKDLLFMLENGEEFIKGIYEAKEEIHKITKKY